MSGGFDRSRRDQRHGPGNGGYILCGRRLDQDKRSLDLSLIHIYSVIGRTGLDHVRNRRISALSKGYKQRVGIAQALLGDPKVIILDEPTVGLDPLQIIEIRDLIKDLGREHTVIFSSHILSEVQTICEKILIIARGKLIAFDEPENLEKRLLSPGEITPVSYTHLMTEKPVLHMQAPGFMI